MLANLALNLCLKTKQNIAHCSFNMAAMWDCIVNEASARLFGFLAHGMFVFLNPYQFSYLPFLDDIFIEVMEKRLGKGSRRDFCNIPDFILQTLTNMLDLFVHLLGESSRSFSVGFAPFLISCFCCHT